MAVNFNRINIGSGYNLEKINTNFQRIETALEDVVSRSGDTPNTMEADLDINGNDLLNVGTGHFTELIVNGATVDVTVQGYDSILASWANTTRASGFDEFAENPTSENLATLVTDETGSGNLVFSTSPVLVTPDLGTPSALTLTNATGLPITGITPSTSSPLGAGSIELGHASDTTLSRSAAGRLAVEGADVLLSSVADQTITGGARITPLSLGNLSGASITPDPGDRPIQKITNNGAGSILPGSNEGQYTLQIINTTGAGTITTTGWTLKGDSFDTTTTSKFVCSCLVTTDIKLMTIVKVV